LTLGGRRGYYSGMFEPSVYAARRAALRAGLARRGVNTGFVVFMGNRESAKHYLDDNHPFQQDASFRYFVGVPLPALAASLDLSTGEEAFFGDDISLDDIVWTGPLPTVAELGARAGIAASRPRAELSKAAAKARGAGAAILYFPPYRADAKLELAELAGIRYEAVDGGVSLPLVRATVELRELKSEAEIAEHEAAVAASVAMHRAAIAAARPGMREYEIVARITEVAIASGGNMAFSPIATTKGATLHTHEYGRTLEEGGLFLLDAGAESAEGYAGDLTTTFPIGKRFDRRQREIYEIVLAMHKAATSLLGPGRPFVQAHEAAERAAFEGLAALGLMKGSADEAIAAGAPALFFPHGIGHQIGLDTHDMENYGEVWVGYDGAPKSSRFGRKSLRLAKPLKPGMVHSVEPGIYFIPELIAQWKAEGRFAEFVNYGALEPYMAVGGIRNEEDWLVTASGARRLGPEFDKGAAAIEALRGGL
jgi:Xaa-Pro aminopeptidase